MTVVIADPDTLSQFGEARQAVEVRDPSGHLLGLFIPTLDPATDPRLRPTISEEELQRREAAGGGRSLTSILVDIASHQR